MALLTPICNAQNKYIELILNNCKTHATDRQTDHYSVRNAQRQHTNRQTGGQLIKPLHHLPDRLDHVGTNRTGGLEVRVERRRGSADDGLPRNRSLGRCSD